MCKTARENIIINNSFLTCKIPQLVNTNRIGMQKAPHLVATQNYNEKLINMFKKPRIIYREQKINRIYIYIYWLISSAYYYNQMIGYPLL